MKTLDLVILVACLNCSICTAQPNGSLVSAYRDQNIVCTLTLPVQALRPEDTLIALVVLENIGKENVLIGRSALRDSDVGLNGPLYDDRTGVFRYGLLDEMDYLHEMTHYVVNLTTCTIPPGGRFSTSVRLPFSSMSGLTGREERRLAIHAKEAPRRFGLQIDFGDLPGKGTQSVALIDSAGRLNAESKEVAIWVDTNIKQFSLGPVYFGAEL